MNQSGRLANLLRRLGHEAEGVALEEKKPIEKSK
jgi:hypothetical protein